MSNFLCVEAYFAVLSNHSYVEVFLWVRPLRHNEVQLYYITFFKF